MIEEIIKYKKINTHFHKYTNSGLYYKNSVCPLCKKLLLSGEVLYLLSNCNKLFPNISIHKDCVLNKGDCIKYLTKEYQKFTKNCFFKG